MFTTFLFIIFVPPHPPPLNQQSDGIPLDFLLEGPQTELRTLSQNCEQTLQKLRTNRIMNKRVFLNKQLQSRLSFPATGPPDPGTDVQAPGSVMHHRFRHLLQRFSKDSGRRLKGPSADPFKNPSETPSPTPSETPSETSSGTRQKPFWGLGVL